MGRVDAVATGGSASQPRDFVDGPVGPGSHAVAPIGPRGTVNGAPAVRNAGSGSSLLTVAEVARRLRVCLATVYRLCREGWLRHVRVSHAIRVPEPSLAEYLRSGG
jgi:excisionase family DNA binding protein